uniref:NADH-ubiquinone oxidoreductase chain 4 n=1 Tax=Tubulipora flabellaris TaxID=365325 RepID=F6GPJ7_9BILA|nr:NADH dehydrogenase subunit 4 [Tubulipora flabellaris]ACB12468.1 NADH dehydrogenase subunit 4 [Tubulipora flabellaris]
MFFCTFSTIILTFMLILFSYFNMSSLCNLCWNWDNFSSAMIILSLWIMMLIFLSDLGYYLKLYILILTMVITFITKNSLMFFISFEFSIIPILLIILLKGYQPERLEAGLSLLLYTFSASTPLLFSILYSYYYFSSFNIMFLSITAWQFMVLSMIGFLVKLPMWSFHLWLPKAHVEAPVGGSMILAAIMLKLGMYGIYRLFSLVNPQMKQMSFILMTVGFIGMIMSSLMCFMSSDIKTLIAYSSISHMSPTLMILLQFNSVSFLTIILLAVSHGFSSSLMFFTGNLLYLNSKSRSMMIQKGNLISNPNMIFILFWAIVFNLSVPPFLTFFSEVMVMLASFMQSYSVIPVFFILVLTTGAYNIYMYVNLGFGKEKLLNTKFIKSKEWLVFFLHSVPLVFIPFLF